MEKSTQPKNFCFVLMPFTEDFDDIYHLGIKEACKSAGTYCERVDEQHFEERILDRIYNQISKADIVLADMTGKNPNVFYEVGYAHALGKTTILLTNDVKDIPFDLKHFPHIIYNGKIKILKEELTKKLLWAIENSKKGEQKFEVDFEVFLRKKNLAKDEVVWTLEKNQSPLADLTILNNSIKTYKEEDYSFGVLTNSTSEIDWHWKDRRQLKFCRTVPLPDGRVLHLFDDFREVLFPDSYTSLTFEILPVRKENNDGFERHYQTVFFRIFTATGFRDFPMEIKYV